MKMVPSFAMYLQAIEALAQAVCQADAKKAEAAMLVVQEIESQQNLSFFPAFGHLCQCLAFSDTDSMLFAVLLDNRAKGQPLASAASLAKVYLGVGGGAAGQISDVLLAQPQTLEAAFSFFFDKPPVLPEGARLVFPEVRPVFHHQALLQTLETALAKISQEDVPVLIALTGKAGTGRSFLLQTLAQRAGLGVLRIDTQSIALQDVPYFCNLARIWGCVICLENWQNQTALVSACLARTKLLFLTAQTVCRLSGSFGVIARQLAPLQPEERLCAMQALFGDKIPFDQLEKISNLYRFDMQKLMAVASRLQGEAICQTLCAQQLKAAIRAENATALSQNATLLMTNKTLEEVILPASQMAQLVAIRECVKNKEQVYRTWGFADKIAYGTGIAALFYGASGTGKTLAANALANELGLSLYRVDLSQLTSKYVGETQKNIGKIFDEAQNGDCVLFFDEADALFSRRTEGGDAQDKHVNAEIAYLLQRTESYDGVMILATNLLQNFDEAFRRRLHYMVHFPLPNLALRQTMWERIFPTKAPVQDVDFAFLASELEVSGAGIRNIALSAAYMAASAQRPIDMACCVQAARREYEKQGKAFPHRLDSIYPPE